jgi:hypothetical protein
VLVREIESIVGKHGPIHRTQLLEVVRDSWGLTRATARVRQAVDRAVALLVRHGEIVEDDGFLDRRGRDVQVRVPAVDDAPVRPVKHVSWSERQQAILYLLGDAGASSRSSLLTAWARLFGWRRTGPEIEQAFDQTVNRLVVQGSVTTGNDTDSRDPPTNDPLLRLT